MPSKQDNAFKKRNDVIAPSLSDPESRTWGFPRCSKGTGIGHDSASKKVTAHASVAAVSIGKPSRDFALAKSEQSHIHRVEIRSRGSQHVGRSCHHMEGSCGHTCFGSDEWTRQGGRRGREGDGSWHRRVAPQVGQDLEGTQIRATGRIRRDTSKPTRLEGAQPTRAPGTEPHEQGCRQTEDTGKRRSWAAGPEPHRRGPANRRSWRGTQPSKHQGRSRIG
jgi:hypothetical protein